MASIKEIRPYREKPFFTCYWNELQIGNDRPSTGVLAVPAPVPATSCDGLPTGHYSFVGAPSAGLDFAKFLNDFFTTPAVFSESLAIFLNATGFAK